MRHIKKKVYQVLKNVEVTDAGSEGQSVARVNDKVIFIKGAVPGDVVDVQLTKKKNNYAEGKVVDIHRFSEKRTEPVCEHFGVCGGCKWQNMKYESQLFYKQKQVSDALRRIGKIDIPEMPAVLGSSEVLHYRNKLEYTFSNKKWLTQEEIENKTNVFSNSPDASNTRNGLGFHIPGMFDKVLDINKCYLQDDLSNKIRLEVKAYALKTGLSFFDIREQQGLLRNLIIRNTSLGEWMVVVVFFQEDENVKKMLEHLRTSFPQITSLMYVINPKKNDVISDLEVHPFSGNNYIIEQLEGLKFKIGPKSFFQTNSKQALELYKVAREFADFKGDELVYDLYTGTGTIANFIAGRVKKVVGVEYIEEAIKDANENSLLNGITNTVFYAGDMKDVLNDEFVSANGKPDVVITDPPRAGMHEDVVNKINLLSPAKIVYVSCNPATQARDIVLLSENYRVSKVQPVDMFPHTHHIENVVLLERIK